MIRRALASDASRLLVLMQQLAAFEGYADRFNVTENDLVERGFPTHRPPEFCAWVVEEQGELLGYAVVYSIPFTFDLRPTVVLKELFVEDAARGYRYGSRLFTAVAEYARAVNARLLRWQVLPDNAVAKRFYRRLRGEEDRSWENWLIDLDRYEGSLA